MTYALTLPLVDFDIGPEVVVLGLVSGMVYGLLGLGLTLIYQSARIINFAHAQVGAIASSVMLRVAVFDGRPYWIGVAAAALTTLAVAGAIQFLVVRRLMMAPRLIVMIATIGVAQVLLAGGSYLSPSFSDLGLQRLREISAAGYPTPFEAEVTIGTLRLHEAELLILMAVPLIVAALTIFLRRTTIGMAARASAENLEAAKLSGIPEQRISMVIWMIAGLLSTAAVLLIAPTRPVNASFTIGPVLLVRALAASLIGGFASMPQVFAGGLVVGVVEALVQWNYPTGGVVELVVFALILGSMFLRRDLSKAIRGAEESSWSLAGTVRALEPRIAALPKIRRARRVGVTVLVAAAVLAPLPASSSTRVLLTSVVLFAIMGLSITLLTGYAGQVSLAQYMFVALGGVVGGRILQLGFPEWMGILYAALGGAALAAVVGLPALRLRGLMLAVTTLAFSVAGGAWLLGQGWLVVVEGGESSLHIPRPRWFGINFLDERNYYYLCVLLLVGVASMVVHLRRTGLGRQLMAVRDNDSVAAALSVPPWRVKLIGFVLSGAIAGLAGYFYGGLLVNFTEAESVNAVGQSQSLLAMVVLGGATSVTGAFLGALYVKGIPYFLSDRLGILATGAGLLMVLMFLPGGLSSLAFRARDWLVFRLTGEGVDSRQGSAPAGMPRQPLPPSSTPAIDGGVVPISATDIVIRFGGLVAVNKVSLAAFPGEIVGLVGPNGAGKTTLFDVLSGQVRPDSGAVLLAGRDVSHLPPEARSMLGLGRTFQQARLFPELPLIDTLKVALEADEPTEVVPSLLGLPPSRRNERAKQAHAEMLLELLGLTPFAYRNCAELSTGTRRVAEMGCLVACGARVLLLDEPTSGVAQREVEQFPRVLREIRAHLGATMVIIAHDIPMLVSLVDRLYVMSAGEIIAEGPPQVLHQDPKVIAAYFGTEEARVPTLTAPT